MGASVSSTTRRMSAAATLARQPGRSTGQPIEAIEQQRRARQARAARPAPTARCPAGSSSRPGHPGPPADWIRRPGRSSSGRAASSLRRTDASARKRIVGIAREAARDERIEARHGQPFGAPMRLAAGGVAVAPVGTGAGVEQHADHAQVEADARLVVGAAAIEQAIELLGAVDAAGIEVAPAAVQRDPQVGVGGAGDRLDAIGNRLAGGCGRSGSAAERPSSDCPRDRCAAGADRGRIAQDGDRDRAGDVARGFQAGKVQSSARPLVSASSTRLGTAPSVK